MNKDRASFKSFTRRVFKKALAALAAEGGDLPAFYAAMAALDPGQRQAFMASAGEPVGAEACAAPL